MKGNINPRVVGATVIGFALVAGAYLVGNFGESSAELQQANIQQTTPVQRVAIEVVDNDGNGIEDWRDEFVTTEPVVLDAVSPTTTYEAPDTLTGEMGINFMQNILYARGYGAFGRTDEEVIDDTVNVLARETAHELYDTPDITIIDEWNDEDIKNYANTAANIIFENSVPNMDSELIILRDILQRQDQSRMAELRTLAEVYKNYRDQTLLLPVPAFLVKEHLDLINTYHALHKDIEAMTLVLDDPAFTLLRLKRYEDDATGLAYALQNMYLALEPHADLFVVADPAAMFTVFGPNYQLPN